VSDYLAAELPTHYELDELDGSTLRTPHRMAPENLHHPLSGGVVSDLRRPSSTGRGSLQTDPPGARVS
jgi:hypothetical protein